MSPYFCSSLKIARQPWASALNLSIRHRSIIWPHPNSPNKSWWQDMMIISNCNLSNSCSSPPWLGKCLLMEIENQIIETFKKRNFKNLQFQIHVNWQVTIVLVADASTDFCGGNLVQWCFFLNDFFLDRHDSTILGFFTNKNRKAWKKGKQTSMCSSVFTNSSTLFCVCKHNS